jgi:hypothetical protein
MLVLITFKTGVIQVKINDDKKRVREVKKNSLICAFNLKSIQRAATKGGVQGQP